MKEKDRQWPLGGPSMVGWEDWTGGSVVRKRRLRRVVREARVLARNVRWQAALAAKLTEKRKKWTSAHSRLMWERNFYFAGGW